MLFNGKWWIFHAVVLVLVMVGIGLAISWYFESKDVVVGRHYEGRLYLVGQEYEQFKQYLANHPEVDIEKLDALSSPNALIDVELYAPAETLIPYGEVSDTVFKASTDRLVLLITTCCIGWVAIEIFVVVGRSMCWD